MNRSYIRKSYIRKERLGLYEVDKIKRSFFVNIIQ